MSYKDLKVWNKAIDLVEEIYRLVNKLPKEEIYALSSQMRRAAVSIPSNIAEGYSRKSTKEYINFLSIAQGSKGELETQLIICYRLNFIDKSTFKTALLLTEEVGKMLTATIKALSDRP